METAVWHWALLKVSSFRSSLRSVCPPQFNVGDDGPPNELSKEWKTEMKTCVLLLGLDAASDLSNCVWWTSSLLPSMLPCWMGHVLRVWNKQNYKEDMAELLGRGGPLVDSGLATIPSTLREAATVRKLFLRSMWIWLIDKLGHLQTWAWDQVLWAGLCSGREPAVTLHKTNICSSSRMLVMKSWM